MEDLVGMNGEGRTQSKTACKRIVLAASRAHCSRLRL
jgi:hypothetical protein